MELWLKQAREKCYVRAISADKVKYGVLCDAASNPWYEGGVSFDWTALHKRITGSDATGRHAVTTDLTNAVDALATAGTSRLQHSKSGEKVMVTVVELASPHWMQSLSEDAQMRSVFSVSRGSDSGVDMYTFLRGPPGQVSVCLDVLATLASVRAQLAEQGIDIHQFLSSFILFAGDFDTLLHQTAAVHKALKGAVGELNIHASSFTPRIISPIDGTWWAALPTEAITDVSDVTLFATDLFFQWLEDSYQWRCLAPIRVFPSPPSESTSTLAPASTSSASPATTEIAAQRLMLFERFVRRLVLPSAARLGFRALRESLPEEGGDLLELAAPLVAAKRTLVGPQKWTTLDLRLALGCVGAYGKDPQTLLQGA